MKFLRQAIFKIFGLKFYLKLVSRTYIRMISMGMMKKKYPEIFHLKKIIQPGDFCLDIGANLGYYSTMMAKQCGPKGKVIAFEPIPVFAEIFRKNTRKYPQVQLQQVALGTEEGIVKMSIPMRDGVIRHGLTQVVDSADHTESAADFEVQMVKGDDVMKHHYALSKVDFIKCDVEGYEQFVMPSFEETINTSLPIIQIELTGKENRSKVIEFLTTKGYIYKILKGNQWIDVNEKQVHDVQSDFYFIPPTRAEQK